jgi:hypothetical protein
MADKPTVNIKVSGKKTGKNDKHPDLFAALKAYFEAKCASTGATDPPGPESRTRLAERQVARQRFFQGRPVSGFV